MTTTPAITHSIRFLGNRLFYRSSPLAFSDVGRSLSIRGPSSSSRYQPAALRHVRDVQTFVDDELGLLPQRRPRLLIIRETMIDLNVVVLHDDSILRTAVAV